MADDLQSRERSHRSIGRSIRRWQSFAKWRASVYRDFFTSAPNASPDVLALPNPYTLAITAFPTAGDFAAYLMTGHLAHHLGQLGSWHAAAGLRKSGAPVAD